MATSKEYYQKITDLRGKMPKAKVPTIDPVRTARTSADVEKELLDKANNFAPDYQELAGLETQAYATPQTELQNFDKRYGGGVGKGLGMGSETSSMLTTIGGRYGTADTKRRAIETQKLTLRDLANTLAAREAAQIQADQYNKEQAYNAQIRANEIERQNYLDELGSYNDAYAMEMEREKAAKGGGLNRIPSPIPMPTPAPDNSSQYSNISFYEDPVTKDVIQYDNVTGAVLGVVSESRGMSSDPSVWNNKPSPNNVVRPTHNPQLSWMQKPTFNPTKPNMSVAPQNNMSVRKPIGRRADGSYIY